MENPYVFILLPVTLTLTRINSIVLLVGWSTKAIQEARSPSEY